MVMVGDRKYDIKGAKAIGIDSIAVLYGFGFRAELEEEKRLELWEVLICVSIIIKNGV